MIERVQRWLRHAGMLLVELVFSTGDRHWRLSALPIILEQTLQHQGLPRTLYEQLNI